MNNSQKYISTILCNFLVLSGVFSQSPWISKGEGYSHIAIGVIPNYTNIFQGNQKLYSELDGSISELNVQAYAEYGWTNRIGTILDIPYKLIRSEVNSQTPSVRNSGSISGLGNIGIGIKYNLIEKPILLTAQVLVNLPSTSNEPSTGLRTGYEATSIVPTLSTGKGYNNSYYYIYAGADLFTNNLSNSIRYGAEYGHYFFDRLWVILALNARESLKDGDRVYLPSFEDSYLFVNNQSYTSFTIKAMCELNESIGLNGSANIISIRANNLPRKAPLSLGFYYKWK